MIAKAMSKKYRPPGNFSDIFEGLEFKSPFKKPQVVEYFWPLFILFYAYISRNP
jgi:hypothetical protein